MTAVPEATTQSQVYVQSSSYNTNPFQHNRQTIASTCVAATTVATIGHTIKDNYLPNSHSNKNVVQYAPTSLQGNRIATALIASANTSLSAAAGISGTNNQHHQTQSQSQPQLQPHNQHQSKHTNTNSHNNSQLHFHIQLPHNHQLQLPLHHAHHHLFNQSQSQFKQLQLKQPSVHHHYLQGANYHPYYQTSTSTHVAISAAPLYTTTVTSQAKVGFAGHGLNVHSHNNAAVTTAHNHNTYIHSVPVHALNQNSNFSAASSSTGGGTASSHAPTQQSNTTGSSLSPPGASASARTKVASPSVSTTTPNAGITRDKIIGACKKIRTEPALTDVYRSERLGFANTHFNWTEDNWKRVIFQDERKFNLDGPDGFSCYFHDMRNNERWLSQRPRGNSVFIYLIVTATGPLHLEVSMTKMKVQSCVDIILRERPNIVAKLGGITDFVLQDHNWSVHAPQAIREWLNTEGIKTQKWPFISHDLNIMENVWGWLIREVFEGGRKFSRKDDLIFRIRDAWSRLPLELLSNLYSTLPERIMQLSYTNGGLTNC